MPELVPANRNHLCVFYKAGNIQHALSTQQVGQPSDKQAANSEQSKVRTHQFGVVLYCRDVALAKVPTVAKIFIAAGAAGRYSISLVDHEYMAIRDHCTEAGRVSVGGKLRSEILFQTSAASGHCIRAVAACRAVSVVQARRPRCPSENTLPDNVTAHYVRGITSPHGQCQRALCMTAESTIGW